VFATLDQNDEIVPDNHVVLEQLCGLCCKGTSGGLIGIGIRIELLELDGDQSVITTVFCERSPQANQKSPQGM
jgi:hypothetical protein